MTLPSGWVEASLGEIAETRLGKMLDAAKNRGDERPYLRNVNVRWGGFDLTDVQIMRVSPEEFEALRVRDGDIFVCEGGEPGRCAVWHGGPMQIVYQKALHRIRVPDGVDPDYVARLLGQTVRQGKIAPLLTGTTIKHLPQVGLQKIAIPVPPPAEQRRIVAKLDALTARLARARVEAEESLSLVKRVRTAATAACFADDANTVRLGDLLSKIEAGKNLRCEERPPRGAEKGVVKVSAVTWGRFDKSQSKTLPPDYAPPEVARIGKGDLLISRANTIELVGAVVLVEEVVTNLYLSDKILRLVMPEEYKRWVLHFLRSPEGRQQIQSASTGNQMSMRNIAQSALRDLMVPMPEAAVRRAHIAMLEGAFARADRLEAEARKALALIDRLEETILAKAFRGELVPQDPSDEPASALLERIRARRAAEPKVKRGRRSQQTA